MSGSEWGKNFVFRETTMRMRTSMCMRSRYPHAKTICESTMRMRDCREYVKTLHACETAMLTQERDCNVHAPPISVCDTANRYKVAIPIRTCETAMRMRCRYLHAIPLRALRHTYAYVPRLTAPERGPDASVNQRFSW